MDDAVKLTPAPGIASRIIEGEALIVMPAQGEAIILNGTGARVWELLGTGAHVDEIGRVLAEEFDVSIDQARVDVRALCDQLLERRALVADPFGGAS